jgi:hypothetical protein
MPRLLLQQARSHTRYRECVARAGVKTEPQVRPRSSSRQHCWVQHCLGWVRRAAVLRLHKSVAHLNQNTQRVCAAGGASRDAMKLETGAWEC